MLFAIIHKICKLNIILLPILYVISIDYWVIILCTSSILQCKDVVRSIYTTVVVGIHKFINLHTFGGR